MTARKRIALVGAGRIGREHAAAVRRSPLLELAGVADPSEPARDAIAGDAPTFPSFGALAGSVGFDAVIVAVPSALHGPVVEEVLEAGVPVLCEKPCGLTPAIVHALAAAASAAGVPLQVGYWRRFVPGLSALRERIAAGELGEVSMLIAAQWDGEPPPASFRDPRSSGGILIDMGVHEFDMLRWLTGQEIAGITGVASDVVWRERVAGDPETVNLMLELSGGATALISLARRHPPGDLCRVEVLGADGAESLTFVRPGEDDEGMPAALQAQAEALAGHGTAEAALVEDAVRALEAATRAGRQLGLGVPDAVPAR